MIVIQQLITVLTTQFSYRVGVQKAAFSLDTEMHCISPPTSFPLLLINGNRHFQWRHLLRDDSHVRNNNTIHTVRFFFFPKTKTLFFARYASGASGCSMSRVQSPRTGTLQVHGASPAVYWGPHPCLPRRNVITAATAQLLTTLGRQQRAVLFSSSVRRNAILSLLVLHASFFFLI